MSRDMEIGSIVWGVKDIERAVEFWGQALNYQLKYPASDDWAILIPKSGNGIHAYVWAFVCVKKRIPIWFFVKNLIKQVWKLQELRTGKLADRQR